MIHVFIGTKAQYVKMAPLLWRLDDSGVAYRLIDSGQHAGLAASFRRELGVRAPDFMLGGGRDVDSIPQALVWTLRLARRFLSPARLRREVFGGRGGICVVHGDTPTTLLSALMARRAGLAVAHVEAGLRTYRWLHPFPEEIVRVLTGRLADVLFAPGPKAAANLRRAGVKGRIVEQRANTVAETVRRCVEDSSTSRSDVLPAAGATPGGTEHVGGGAEACADAPGHADADGAAGAADAAGAAGAAPAVVTMHRVENLHRRRRREALVDLVEELAARTPVCWVVHGPTEKALSGAPRRRLIAAGAELRPLMAHGEFLAMVAAAPFVITDGGSIQEECALLGVPTLLWRGRTDREDGLGANVVLSRYDSAVARRFLDDPERRRRPGLSPDVSPSAEIAAELAEWR